MKKFRFSPAVGMMGAAVCVLILSGGAGWRPWTGASPGTMPSSLSLPRGYVTPQIVPTLTVELDSSLNEGGGVKATTISSCVLLKDDGTVAATATIIPLGARFILTGLSPGFYTIRINGINGCPVPTRLDNTTTATYRQVVGTNLADANFYHFGSLIYEVRTYPVGQGGHLEVNYSNGADAQPFVRNYVILYLTTSPQRLEVRVLVSNKLVTFFNNAGPHEFASWIIGGNGHGHAGPSNTNCSCHAPIGIKAATYAGITTSHGYCYGCHYGPLGASKGFVKPTS
jgi:hypothetical protein